MDNGPPSETPDTESLCKGQLPIMPDANNGYPSGKSIASSDNSLPQDSAQTPVIQTDDTHFEHSDKASHAEKPKDALSKTVIPDSVTKQGDEALPLTTEIHEPNDPVSTAVIEQQPVFSRNQALPMSFHVMTGATRSVVEKMIIVSPNSDLPIYFLRYQADQVG